MRSTATTGWRGWSAPRGALLDALVGELDDVPAETGEREIGKTIFRSEDFAGAGPGGHASAAREGVASRRRRRRRPLRDDAARDAAVIPVFEGRSFVIPRYGDNGAKNDDDGPNYAARRMGSLDDGGAGWLERAARTRAAASFREPLAAAAIRALSDLSAGCRLFAQCLGEWPSSARAGGGAGPGGEELAELFAGPIADVVAPFASKNIVGRETDGAGGAAGDDDAERCALGR